MNYNAVKQLMYYIKKSRTVALFAFRKAGQKIKNKKSLLVKLPGTKTARPLVARYRLLFSIGSAIVICLLLTVFSTSLYVITGTSKLDLSKPGYEEVRKKITRKSANETSFGSNGPLDKKIINDYLEKYKKQAQDLREYDSFNPKLIDDIPLGLNAEATPLTEPAIP